MANNTIEFAVTGRYALFSDPVIAIGGEKLSYPLPTYEAIKGVVQSIYYKPTFMWIVDNVRIMNPIMTTRRGMKLHLYDSDKSDLAYYTYLVDVHYQVRAHFEWNLNHPELAQDRNDNKHYFITQRALAHGGRRDIWLGTRDCQAYVTPCRFGEGKGAYDNTGNLAYGHVYHGITYADEAINDEDKNNITVRFWDPILRDGVLTYPRPEQCVDKRIVKPGVVKQFGRG